MNDSTITTSRDKNVHSLGKSDLKMFKLLKCDDCSGEGLVLGKGSGSSS